MGENMRLCLYMYIVIVPCFRTVTEIVIQILIISFCFLPCLPLFIFLINQHLFCHLQPGETFVYNLGNGYRTNNPEEATQKFLEREFPELLNCQSAKHDVLFVPDTFIYGEVAKKVRETSTAMECYATTKDLP